MGEHPGTMRVWNWQNLVVCAWRGQATSPAAAVLARIMRDLHARASDVRRSYIHLIPDQAGLPDAAARRTISNIMTDYEESIACVGVVIEGGGFWASAMRNVVIGLRVLRKTPFEYRIHATDEEVVSWLPQCHTQKTGVPLLGEDLRKLLLEAHRWQTVQHDEPLARGFSP